MHDDPALRVLLGLILFCLLLLVAQGFGLGAGTADGPYRISLIKSKPPWLMRVNTATGEVEQLELRDGRAGQGRWVALGQREPDLAEEGGESALDEPFAAAEPSPEPTVPPAAPPPSSAPAAPTELADLVEAVQPGNPREIRIWAANLLGSYVAQAPDTSIPALVQALDDPDAGLVLAAARSLGASQHPDALSALRKLESHPDPAVQAAAREAFSGQH